MFVQKFKEPEAKVLYYGPLLGDFNVFIK